jgi:hypothetical protein
VLDLEETDGPDWHDKLATNAAIMVGFETDVHEKEGGSTTGRVRSACASGR